MAACGKCEACPVRRTALCSVLEDGDLNRIQHSLQIRHLLPGQFARLAGDPAGMNCNVVSGLLKVSANTIEGREQIVGLLQQSDLVGTPLSTTSQFDIIALTNVTLCVWAPGQVQRLLLDHPRLGIFLLERTFQSLEDARHRMVMLARQRADGRIAAFLLTLAPLATRGSNVQGEDEAVAIRLPLSRGQIANMLGLTLETVSRQMTRLEAMGAITVSNRRQLTVSRRSLLVALAEAV